MLQIFHSEPSVVYFLQKYFLYLKVIIPLQVILENEQTKREIRI